MAKTIIGNPAILENIARVERDFGVKVSYKPNSDVAYIIEGKNTNSFLNAILGIEGIQQVENNY